MLPSPLYLLLAVEAGALVWLYQTHVINAADRIGHGIGWRNALIASMLYDDVYSLQAARARAGLAGES